MPHDYFTINYQTEYLTVKITFFYNFATLLLFNLSLRHLMNLPLSPFFELPLSLRFNLSFKFSLKLIPPELNCLTIRKA